MIYLDSDTIFLWSGLRDSVTGEYVNDAVVTGSLQDLDGNELSTFSFSHVADSNGDYAGSITAGVADTLTACGEYLVAITAAKDGSTTTRRERHKANYAGYK